VLPIWIIRNQVHVDFKALEGEKCCPYGLSEIRYRLSPHNTISTSQVSRINLLKPVPHNLHMVTGLILLLEIFCRTLSEMRIDF
jgi:hypothetical protein